MVASDESIVDNFRSVYEYAKTNSQRVENILYVPNYTPEVLLTAEQRVADQRAVSSLSGIGKTAIILSSGEDAANQLFLDGRKVPVKTAHTLHDMAMRVKLTVESKGYMTRDELLDATAAYMIRRAGYHRDKERSRIRGEVERVWNKYKRCVLLDTGMAYKKPSAEEKRRFGLCDNRWIITKPRKSDQIPERIYE